MNYSCFGRASWKFIFLASYMVANLLIIHWRTMDSPQVDQKVVWARAVSKVTILNETITSYPWKNHLELSPSPLAPGKHPTHVLEVGEMLAVLLILPESVTWRWKSPLGKFQRPLTHGNGLRWLIRGTLPTLRTQAAKCLRCQGLAVSFSRWQILTLCQHLKWHGVNRMYCGFS